MAGNNVIITTCFNKPWEEFQPFFQTAQPFADRIIVFSNVKGIEDRDNIEVIQEEPSNKCSLMFSLWIYYKLGLELCDEEDRIILCDSRDVIFQKNIFEVEDIDWQIITACSESQVLIKDESWTYKHLKAYYPEHYYGYRSEYALNSGITMGNGWFLNYFTNRMLDGIDDINKEKYHSNQAIYNMIIHAMTWNRDATISHHHVLNYGTFMKKYPNIHILEYGEPFYILHQYDRGFDFIPDIEKKFNVKINSSWGK